MYYIIFKIIISKLRIAWEMHVCAISISKNPKKTNFFGDFSRRHFSFPRMHILIMTSHPSRRGSNFGVFLASDVEKTTIFWESTLCEIIAFFRTHQSRCKTKFQKKLLFWGIFPDVFFIMFPFSWLCFYTVLSGWSTTSGWAAEKASFFRWKNAIFSRPKNDVFSASEKMTFFRVRQYGAFWLPRSHCGDGYHISPPTGLNLESAEISTSKLANSKQQMSKSIQQFLKCTLISSPLVRWKWPTQVGILGTLWWGWELGMMQSTTSAAIFSDRKKKNNVFSGICKNAVFSGHGSRMTVRKNIGYLAGWLSGWLAGYLAGWLSLTRWLAGYLAIGFVAAWLAICLLAIWLIGRLALAIWLALWMARSLACYLSGYLDGWLGGGLLTGLIGWWLARWLADWMVAWLAACLAGRLIGGAGRLVIWLGYLAGWLAGFLAGYLIGWRAISGFRWLSGYLAG